MPQEKSPILLRDRAVLNKAENVRVKNRAGSQVRGSQSQCGGHLARVAGGTQTDPAKLGTNQMSRQNPFRQHVADQPFNGRLTDAKEVHCFVRGEHVLRVHQRLPVEIGDLAHYPSHFCIRALVLQQFAKITSGVAWRLASTTIRSWTYSPRR